MSRAAIPTIKLRLMQLRARRWPADMKSPRKRLAMRSMRRAHGPFPLRRYLKVVR